MAATWPFLSAICCAVIIVFIPQPKLCAGSGYYYANWTRTHGLPGNETWCMRQTRDGYIWIATPDGLVRFDGVRFTVFEPKNTPAMSSSVCRSLAEDTDGNLWVGTDGGLICLSEHGVARYELPVGAGPCQVFSVRQCKSGGVWVAFYVENIGSGLAIARRGYPCKSVMVEGLGKPTEVVEEETGAALVAADFLARVHPGDGQCEVIWPSDPWFRYFGAMANLAGRRGTNWVVNLVDFFGNTNRFLLVDGQLETAEPVIPLAEADCSVPGKGADEVSVLALVRSGALPLANEKIPAYIKGKGRDYLSFPDAGTSFQDRDGNTWITTASSGLVLLRRKSAHTITTADGLPNDITWSICEAADGAMWVGTEGGLARFGPTGCENYTDRDGLLSNTVLALACDKEGTLWVGTGRGLCRLRKGLIEPWSPPGEWRQWKVRAIVVARDGSVWVGTVSGLYRIKGDHRFMFTPEDGLPAPDVRAILEDWSGTLWIGTVGGGLCRLDPELASAYASSSRSKTERVSPFTHRFTTKDGLSHDNVWALCLDKEGVLWIGTERGLNRFRDGRFSAFTVSQGLPSDLVNHIVEDDHGYLWIGHDEGIYRVAKHELNNVADGTSKVVVCETFSECDGLLALETNGQKSQPAAIRARDGRIWFATVRGLAVFDPATARGNKERPLVVIERVLMDGHVIFDNGPELGPDMFGATYETRLQTRVPMASLRKATIQFGPGWGKVLEVCFTANSFVEPDEIRFKCRLIGFDSDWHEIGRTRRATYINLRPGRYRFEVTAKTRGGIASDSPAYFEFAITPFFWQTLWFKLGTIVAVAVAILLVHQWRVREVRKVQTLETEAELLRERARIAKDLHDGLGGTLARLALLVAEIERNVGADSYIRQQKLRMVAQCVREGLETIKDLLWSTQPASDSLEGLTNRILQYADQLFSSSSTRCRYEVPENLPEIRLSPECRHHVLYAAKEALNNVLKHARADFVHVSVDVEDSIFTIEISDDGKGCDLSEINPRASDTLHTGVGHGIQIMRGRIESIGGKFELNSRPGKGTTVRIQIQLNQTGRRA